MWNQTALRPSGARPMAPSARSSRPARRATAAPCRNPPRVVPGRRQPQRSVSFALSQTRCRWRTAAERPRALARHGARVEIEITRLERDRLARPEAFASVVKNREVPALGPALGKEGVAL